MSQQELQMVNDMLRSGPDMSQMSLDQVRALIDEAGGNAKLPDGLRLEPAVIDGVTAEWSSTPAADEGSVLLYMHGGGYLFGSIESHRGLVTNLGMLAGARTLAINYRLAPENAFPSSLDDVVSSYKHLLDSGVDPARIAVCGDSAGGGLAMALLVAARETGLPLPGAALCISPWVDMTLTGESMRTKAPVDALVSRDLLSQAIGAYVGSRAEATDPRVSPLHADLSGLPPVMVQVGSHEVMLDDATRLAARLGAADVSVRLDVWGSMPHVWHLYADILGEGRDALEQAAGFLKQHIR